MSSNLRGSHCLSHSESVAPFLGNTAFTVDSSVSLRGKGWGWICVGRETGRRHFWGFSGNTGQSYGARKQRGTQYLKYERRAPSSTSMTVLEKSSYTPVGKEEAGGSKPLKPQNVETDGETPTGNSCPWRTVASPCWGCEGPTTAPPLQSQGWRGKAGYGKGGGREVF